MEFWEIVGILVLSAGAAVVIWATQIERHLRAIRNEHQPIAVLPAGSKPIRVLHVSDFHLAPWQKRKLAWISKLAKLDVDLIVDTGDNLGHIDAIDPTLAAMKPLAKLPGVFVNGSNDYFAPHFRNPLTYFSGPSERISETPLDTAKLVAGFEGFGWLNLNNRGGMIEVNGLKLGFIGTDDIHENRGDLDSLAESTTKLSGADVIIAVTHAPYLSAIHASRDAGAAVLFAGHTHGGQVCIPGFGAIVTNCDLPRSAAKGLSVWSSAGKSIYLNVCAGLGHSIFAPVRFWCRPEVRVVTLVAKEE